MLIHLLNWFRRKNLASRQINRIEFDQARGVVIKRDGDKQKLIREIQWYLNVPSIFKNKIPRILSYSLNTHDPLIEMQYIEGLPLDQGLMASSFDLSTWNQIQAALHVFLKQCLEEGERNEISHYRQFKMMEYVYLRKTMARMNDYEETFAAMVHQGPVVNGRTCLSLSQAQTQILKWLNRPDFQAGFMPGFLHGDLSFSNILYSERDYSFYLVDPRGSFGEVGNYGDVRYDLAKILQGSHGHYDFILHGHFELREKKANHYSFNILMRPEQLHLCNAASRLLFQAFAVPKPDLLFIESLLFLSLVPMHADRPRAQKAFLLRGLEILTDALHLRDREANKEQKVDALPGLTKIGA